jgi:hypothetical protein
VEELSYSRTSWWSPDWMWLVNVSSKICMDSSTAQSSSRNSSLFLVPSFQSCCCWIGHFMCNMAFDTRNRDSGSENLQWRTNHHHSKSWWMKFKLFNLRKLIFQQPKQPTFCRTARCQRNLTAISSLTMAFS